MIAHILIRVKDFTKSEKFYRQVLGTLGLNKNIGEENVWCGWSEKEEPLFEISQADQDNPAHTKVHIVFQAKSKLEVEEFYRVAILNGGSDNGKPGVREEYAKNYYACFVKDLDGNNIECVYFEDLTKTDEEQFDNWNGLKKIINKVERNFYVKPREVVWINLGQNVGDEENGKGEKFERPVLVLKVFNKNLFYGIPLSTKIKPNNKYYFEVNVKSKDENGVEVVNQRSAILSQARLFDTKRVNDGLGYISEGDFQKTKNAFKAVF